MITLRSESRVDGARGRDVVEFLLHCDDGDYQSWWPGTHLQFHAVARAPGEVGTVVYMDELVGTRHLKMNAVVTEVVPGKKIVWQLARVVRLPARLVLELEDDAAGVRVTHTVLAGFRGVGRVLDPLLRRILSADFARALDAHVKAEFPRLGPLLAARA